MTEFILYLPPFDVYFKEDTCMQEGRNQYKQKSFESSLLLSSLPTNVFLSKQIHLTNPSPSEADAPVLT